MRNAFMGLKRQSTATKWATAALLLGVILYAVFSCLERWPVAMAAYQQMLLETSTRGLLPVCLILFFVGSCQPSALVLARRSARSIFTGNFVWLVVVVVLCVVLGTAIFGLTTPLVYGSGVLDGMPHILLVLAVRMFMMCLSVSLIALLLVGLGVRWPVAVIALLAVFTLGNWVLTAFAGTMTQYLYYFWYPIGESWPLIVTNQVMPFIGFLIVMIAANLAVFSRRDHLEG